MGKIKIHEIAKEMGLTSKEIIEKANELGIEAKSHMSGVDEQEANKIKGIRCAHVNDLFSAEMTRRHNNANVIALGARIATKEDIVSYVDKFLTTEFEGGRHENRVNKLNNLDNK